MIKITKFAFHLNFHFRQKNILYWEGSLNSTTSVTSFFKFSQQRNNWSNTQGDWLPECWLVSVFEPRVSWDGRFAAVAIVVQQLLVGLDVSGRHQDQMGASVDGVELCLAVSALAVVDEPS